MTLYQAIQYFKYRWKAKGRHGTHSPFVYSFVEDVLRESGSEDMLMKNLVQYFHFKEVVRYPFIPNPKSNLTSDLTARTLPDFNSLYIFQGEPSTNQLFFDEHMSKLLPEDVLLISPLYKSKQYTLQWEQMKDSQKVKLSMDLFDIGLLFFRDEFKEKQHFVLKY